MSMVCNFGDADKIRKMVKDKYPYSGFLIEEHRNVGSSLNNIHILDKGKLIIVLESALNGYFVRSIDSTLWLEFIGDIYDCLKEIDNGSKTYE